MASMKGSTKFSARHSADRQTQESIKGGPKGVDWYMQCMSYISRQYDFVLLYQLR